MGRSDPVPIGQWAYNWHDRPRPFVHPVTTPSGRVLTVDAPADHPWHHALWFTIKFVNGENFWEEYDDYGLLVQDRPRRVLGATDAAGRIWRSHISWQRPGNPGGTGAEVVIDQVVELALEQHRDMVAMDWDVRLVPRVDVVLDRTPFTTWGGYGGLTFRGRGDWHDTTLWAPGHPWPPGDDTRARLLGDGSRWCSLEGMLPGPQGAERPAGMAILDHPGNPNHPTPWYASTRADTYGDEGWSNFVNAAFLWHGPLEVAAGEELRLRHRVVTWDDESDHERIDSEWDRWVSR